MCPPMLLIMSHVSDYETEGLPRVQLDPWDREIREGKELEITKPRIYSQMVPLMMRSAPDQPRGGQAGFPTLSTMVKRSLGIASVMDGP